MEIKRLRKLALEVYKTINNLNPSYMKSIFKMNSNRTSARLKYNIDKTIYNSVTYGRNSLRVAGQILWNSLPNEANSLNFTQLKKFMNNWGCFGCKHYKKYLSYIEAIKK